MVLPPKSVKAGYYWDDGSIVVQVTDQRGTFCLVTFPFDHDGIITSYKTAFEEPIDHHGKKAPLKDPARAKAIMIRLLKDYGDKQDEYYELTLRRFSEPPAQIGEKIFWKVRNFIN